MFIVLYSQLHSDIVTIAKKSITPNFKIVHKNVMLGVYLLFSAPSACRTLSDPRWIRIWNNWRYSLLPFLYIQKRVYLITISVTPYMTRFLLPRVNAVHSHLEKIITSKCCVMLVSPTSKIIFLLTKPRKISMIHWQGNSCVPAS